MVQFKVDERSLAKLKETIRTQILVPKLDEISRGVRKDISDIAEPFRGARSPSIADTAATTTIKNRKDTKYRIQPVPGTEAIFYLNLRGLPEDTWYNVDAVPSLRAWVDKKKPGYPHKRIKVRGRESKGTPVPLGHPDRDMFGIAFENLIGRDRTKKYGLK